jgi:predicted TIM-barrel fold metal-dependent hydrolase
MIIDAHTHIFESGKGGPFGLPASAEDLVRDMDDVGVDISLVIPLPGVATNEFVARECRRFPDRLALVYTPDFSCDEGPIPTMERFCESEAPHALKVHPRVQRVTVSDPRVVDVLGWAVSRRLPVIFDVFPWGESLHDPDIRPLAYHQVAERMPELQLVLAHAGGSSLIDAFMVAKSNRNVFLEFSMTPVYFRGSSIEGDCTFVCRRLPEGRVLYGSDFPNVRLGESLAHARDWVATLEKNAQAAFFEGAARMLYGL